ncbi:TPA: ead/Ea22-like family protein [Pseudomonas aeruginosa]|nr:ead/Ea22-like family protein [Pseudomonas aeruginosa]
MTDHAELRRLAELADALYGMPSLEHEYAISKFRVASTPKTILAMLDEIDGLRSRLEIDERTPHDGIACRDETIKVLDEKCDRLKAENEVLRGALQAVVDDPTWRSNDNTLWPKITKALDKGATK